MAENGQLAYFNLNLSLDSPAAVALLNGPDEAPTAIEIEQRGGEASIPLSPDDGETIPALLTPKMQQWLQMNILPLRNSAITDLQTDFRANVVHDDSVDLILEADLARYHAEHQAGVRDAVKNFIADQHASAALQDFQTSLRTYWDLRWKKVKREPLVSTEWVNYVVLTILGIPEFFLNYTSMSKVEFLPPFFAGALCVFVALLIGLASHVHGEYWKQHRQLVGDHVDIIEQRGHIRVYWLAYAALGIALLIVLGGRWYLLKDAIAVSSLFGGSVLGNYFLLLWTLLGNLAVYILGLGFIFVRTDPFPGFAEAKRAMQRARKRYMRQYERNLRPLLKQPMAALADKESHRKSREQTYRGMTGYGEVKARVTALIQKDGEVVALLGAYRSKLLHTLRARGIHGPAFSFESLDPADIGIGEFKKTLTPDEYERLNLKLPVIGGA